VPWGYTNPPAVLPALEPPAGFHTPGLRRGLFALKGRASPRLYGLGLTLGLPGIAALLLYLVAVSVGFKLRTGAVPAWLTLEVVAVVAGIGLIGWAAAQSRQRRADGWRDYNGPSPLLLAGALLALTTALELPLAVGLKVLGVDTESGIATLLLMLTYFATYLGLVHFLAVRVGALTWHDVARPRRLAPSPDDWGSSEPLLGPTGPSGNSPASWRARVRGGRVGDILIPLAFVVPLLFASNLLSVVMLLVLGLRGSDISAGTTTPTDGLSMILLFIAVALVAPAGEEVFFRGFATNAWGRSISRNSAILRASLFFAFIHIINTVGASTDASVSWRVALFNFGARVPVAFALTWLYMRRRSILASGTLHAAYNGLITLISFL
jgi:membrane protease YdiL (CAAX protease family)